MRILLNCQSGLGINLLAVPTIRAIKRKYPDSYVHLIVQFKVGAELLDGCPYYDDISVVNYQMIREPGALAGLLKKIRDENYDYSFVLFPGNRFDKNIFQRLVKARHRVSFDYKYRKTLNLNFLNSIKVDIDYKAHDVEQNLNLLKVVGIDPDDEPKELELFIPEEARKRADDMIMALGTHKKLVGVHAGSSKDLTMEMKRWPSRYFSKLLDTLVQNYDCEVLLFGSRNEDVIKNEIESAMSTHCKIVSETDINTTAAIIEKCRMFISNDSGLMHIAAAAGVRTVGIFGPTDPVRTAPYGEGHIVVRRGLECSPCFSVRSVGKTIECPYPERKCLVELKPDHVMNRISSEADRLLKNEVKADAHN